MPKHTEESPETPELTQQEKLSAALNLPAHAKDTEHFKLGDREFTVLDLNYDDFMEFIGYMQPLVDSIASGFAGALLKKPSQDLPGITLPNPASFSFGSIIKYCSKDLPKLVVLVCNTEARQKEEKSLEVTEKFVRKNLKDPIQAVEIIMLQANKNQMISRIGSFFVQYLPQFQMAKNLFLK
jgi:hypothetical protein